MRALQQQVNALMSVIFSPKGVRGVFPTFKSFNFKSSEYFKSGVGFFLIFIVFHFFIFFVFFIFFDFLMFLIIFLIFFLQILIIFSLLIFLIF